MTRLSFGAVFAAGWLAAVPFGGLSRAAVNPPAPADDCPAAPAPCPPAGVSCAPGLTIECPPPQVTFRTVAARLHPCTPVARPACVACARPQFITLPAPAAPQFTYQSVQQQPVMVYAAPQAVQLVQAAPQYVAAPQMVAAPQFVAAPQVFAAQQFVAAPQAVVPAQMVAAPQFVAAPQAAMIQAAAPQFVAAPQSAMVQAVPQFIAAPQAAQQFVAAPQAAQPQAATQQTCPEFDLQAALAMLVRARQGVAHQSAARPAGANAGPQAAGGVDELSAQLKRIEDRLTAAERATQDNTANIEGCVKVLTRILDQLGQTAPPPAAPKK